MSFRKKQVKSKPAFIIVENVLMKILLNSL